LIFYDWNHIKRQLAKKSRLIVLVIILSLCIIFTRDNAQQLAKFSSIYNEKVKISPIYNEKIQQQHDKVIQQMSFSSLSRENERENEGNEEPSATFLSILSENEKSSWVISPEESTSRPHLSSSSPSTASSWIKFPSQSSSLINNDKDKVKISPSSESSSPSTPRSSSSIIGSRATLFEKVSPVMSNQIESHSTNPPTMTTAQTAKRKITFSPQDLETTKEFVINKPNFCDEDRGATNDLLVVVNSAVTHFEERDAIRQTWGQFAVERGSLLLFLIGSPDPSSSDSDLIQERVFREEQSHGDLLQGSFVENYYNLTLKTISLLRWVNSTCDQIKYILKVDDDMFVNMQMVVDFCETRTFNKAVIGKLARRWKPHRNPLSKWYVPVTAFNGSVYPNFATGPSYMLSGDAVGPLIDTALSLTPIYLEDVYVTGIVAEKAGVRRLNHALIRNVRLRVDACSFKRFMTSHRHTPKEIISLWKLVYDAEALKKCTPPASPVKPLPQPQPQALNSIMKSSSVNSVMKTRQMNAVSATKLVGMSNPLTDPLLHSIKH